MSVLSVGQMLTRFKGIPAMREGSTAPWHTWSSYASYAGAARHSQRSSTRPETEPECTSEWILTNRALAGGGQAHCWDGSLGHHICESPGETSLQDFQKRQTLHALFKLLPSASDFRPHWLGESCFLHHQNMSTALTWWWAPRTMTKHRAQNCKWKRLKQLWGRISLINVLCCCVQCH